MPSAEKTEEQVARAALAPGGLQSTGAWTPGPWGFGNTGPEQRMVLGDNGRGNYVCHIQIQQSGGGAIAACMEPQREANAALIAAAPDLYEALDDLMENPKFVVSIGGNPNMVDALIARAKAALSRARGEV